MEEGRLEIRTNSGLILTCLTGNVRVLSSSHQAGNPLDSEERILDYLSEKNCTPLGIIEEVQGERHYRHLIPKWAISSIGIIRD